MVTKVESTKWIHKSERKFAENFFGHDNWDYQPPRFPLKCGTTYRPDFYDRERNTYVEVIASHSGYYANGKKYKLFKDEYPDKILELRNLDGSIYDPKTRVYSEYMYISFGYPKVRIPEKPMSKATRQLCAEIISRSREKLETKNGTN